MPTELTSPLLPRAVYPIAAVLSGCFLFGGGSRSTVQPEVLDTAQAYREHLVSHPDDPGAERYRGRVAELELVEARAALRPVFADGARFAGQVDDEAFATLGQDAQMIFDSEQDGWLGYQVTRIAPDLKQPVRVFAREGKSLALVVGKDEAGPYFSVEEPAGIPLVSTASFDAHIRQWGNYGGGLRFCFFSPTPDSCEDGYTFSYDKAHFQAYALERWSGGQSTSLCQYQMDTTNTQHSDSITVDASSGKNRLRDPDVEIHAHHGYLTVHFNGKQICQVQDQSFSEGFFVLGQAPAISELTITLNGGSSPVYALADTLTDVEAGGEPLNLRDGSTYEGYNAFVADYNAYLAVLAGGEFPEAFHHSYFGSFFGKAEADEAFKAIESSQNIDDYVAYLEKFPLNAHKNEIQKKLFSLARDLDTREAYASFQTLYPQSVARLDIRKRIGDIEWRETVKKPTKKNLERYLAKYPDGYYARRAQLLLEGLDYYAQHKTEVDEAHKILLQAQTLVDKSPVTAPWEVEIVDYQNGSVYFNLNNGPVISRKAGATDALFFVTHEQYEAHDATCSLLESRVPSIDFCVMLYGRDYVNAHEPFPVAEAVQDALTRFYTSRRDRGETVNMTRMLELLDQMAQEKGMTLIQRKFMAQTYARLGLFNEAVDALYRFALSGTKRSDVSYMAKGLLEGSAALAQNSDFQWVVKRFGE